jgi:hypothetical protein
MFNAMHPNTYTNANKEPTGCEAGSPPTTGCGGYHIRQAFEAAIGMPLNNYRAYSFHLGSNGANAATSAFYGSSSAAQASFGSANTPGATNGNLYLSAIVITTGISQYSTNAKWASGGYLAWGSSATAYGQDTTVSRKGAGIVQIGTTAANSLGTLLATGTQLANPFSVAGTAIPACASAYLGTRYLVSDATVATPGTAYTGSGTFTIAVECTFNSTGSVYTWIID